LVNEIRVSGKDEDWWPKIPRKGRSLLEEGDNRGGKILPVVEVEGDWIRRS